MENFLKATLVDRKEVAEDTCEITLEIDSQDFFFVPGQYIWLILTELKYPDERGNRRAFSILSNSKDKVGRVRCVFRKSNSGFKKTLIDMPIGSTLRIEGPFGFCTLPQDEETPVVFLVGGVGIPSVYTMINYATANKSLRRIVLIYANKNPRRAAYLNELQNLQRENKNFTLVQHLGDLNQETIFNHTKDFSDPMWYVFGPEAMVFSVGEILLNNNISPKRIETEEFRLSASLFYKENWSIIKTEAGFKMAIDNAFNHIIITDVEGRILYANHGAEIITGYSIKEMIGNTPRLWGGLMGRDFYESLWKTIKEDKKTFMGEVRNRKKNGDLYTARIQISPFLDSKDQNLVGFVATEEDISKEKELDHAKTEFVSLASHQLRTPLTTIKWQAEIMLSGEMGKLTSKQIKSIQDIYDSNARMISLTNSLLYMSRMEFGTFIQKTKPTDVPTSIKNELRQLHPLINQKKLKISIRNKKIPPFNIDPSAFSIILQNLFSNATKYSPNKGKVIIEANLDEKGRKLNIGVSDSGYGIPKDEQDKIFTKLFRASNARKIDPQGNGLGLYLVKLIVEKINGKIWFESEEGKGTTFHVELPIVELPLVVGQRERERESLDSVLFLRSFFDLAT